MNPSQFITKWSLKPHNNMEREDQVYDRDLFLQVIGSYPSIKSLRYDNYDGIHVQFFEGLTGKLVPIETTDLEDDLTFSEGCGILIELGLNDLIDTLFPPIPALTEEQELAIIEDGILKDQALKGLDD